MLGCVSKYLLLTNFNLTVVIECTPKDFKILTYINLLMAQNWVQTGEKFMCI